MATVHAAPDWQNRKEAQKLVLEAKGLAKQGDFKKAAKKYKKADELTPAPSYKLELARMLVALEDFVQAAEVLTGCVETEPRQWAEKVAFKKCQQLQAEVEERTPTLEVTVFEPSADQVSIRIDGDAYDPAEGPLAFNPGKVKVEASADGYEEFSKTVKLKEGDRETLEITLKGGKKAKKDEEEDEEGDDGGGLSPIWAYSTWGLGAVGLGVGIGFGIAAIKSTNEILRLYGCEDGVCPPEAAADLDTAKLNGNVSTAGFIIGFAGLTTGTILYLLSGDDEDESEPSDEEGVEVEAKPILGPGFIGVTGTF
ncbi:MAG: hypothetical protein R3B72_36755 [Polyangiaceae bacterium]